MARTAKPTGDEALIYIDANEALSRAEEVGIKITLATLLNWVSKYQLGIQPGGNNARWFINKAKFEEFLHGKNQSATITD